MLFSSYKIQVLSCQWGKAAWNEANSEKRRVARQRQTVPWRTDWLHGHATQGVHRAVHLEGPHPWFKVMLSSSEMFLESSVVILQYLLYHISMCYSNHQLILIFWCLQNKLQISMGLTHKYLIVHTVNQKFKFVCGLFKR